MTLGGVVDRAAMVLKAADIVLKYGDDEAALAAMVKEFSDEDLALAESYLIALSFVKAELGRESVMSIRSRYVYAGRT